MYVKFIGIEVYGEITDTYDTLIGRTYSIRLSEQKDTSLTEVNDDMVEHITAEEYLASKIINE